jgi:hypothetical protein
LYLLLTDGYGQGEGKIVCVSEETGAALFEHPAEQSLSMLIPWRRPAFLFAFVIAGFPRLGCTQSSFGLMANWSKNAHSE